MPALDTPGTHTGIELDAMTVDQLRAEYAMIRDRSHGSRGTFRAAVEAIVRDRTPLGYVLAARAVAFACRRCRGTGRFSMRADGRPNGKFEGPCFRCDGKGVQNDNDVRRNHVYDEWSAARAMMADLAG